MIIIGFYLLYIGLALLLAVMVFRLLKRHGKVVALLVSMLSLIALALFFPIPIHGGFTFPLEIAWYELQREQWHREESREDEKQLAFRQQLEQRFAGPITQYAEESAVNGWRKLVLNSGESAWLDDESGLLWQAPQSVMTGEQMLNLDEAKRFCQQQPPQGFWALPGEAELALLWQHGGHRLMPGTGQSSTALLLDSELQLQMATHFRGRVAGHALRCVAISDSAPRGGYSSSDLPLSVWNHYQLNKSEIYTSTTIQTDPVPYQEMK